MSDLIDAHAVKVIAIKKGGSSMTHKAFAGMMFDPRAVTNKHVRWLVFIRNPMARLVSAYNHFIVKHKVNSEQFGPTGGFHVWLRWWLDEYPTGLDHHLWLQTIDLADRFSTLRNGEETGDLLLCPLEKCIDYAEHIRDYCYGYRPSLRTDFRHPHAPWPKYYELPEVQPLLPEVRMAVRPDFLLWLHLAQLDEPEVVTATPLSKLFVNECN